MKKTIFLILLLGFGLCAFGQTSSSGVPTGGISSYSYDGERSGAESLKMKVYIIGQVYKPGLYVVPDDTDFLTLLALAGGPREDAKLSKIRVIHAQEIEVVDTLDVNGEPTQITRVAKPATVTSVNLKRYINDPQESDPLPVLQPGDTVVVSGTIYYAFSKVADLLSGAAIALSVYNLIINLK